MAVRPQSRAIKRAQKTRRSSTGIQQWTDSDSSHRIRTRVHLMTREPRAASTSHRSSFQVREQPSAEISQCGMPEAERRSIEPLGTNGATKLLSHINESVRLAPSGEVTLIRQ
jgi:hypothetical protein